MSSSCSNLDVNSILLLKERIIKVETLLERHATLMTKFNGLDKSYNQAIESEKKAKKDAAKYLEKYCRLSKKYDGLVSQLEEVKDIGKKKSNELENLKNEFEKIQLVLHIYKTERNIIQDIKRERHFLLSSLWKLLRESDINKYKSIAAIFFKRFKKDLEELKLDDFRHNLRTPIPSNGVSKSCKKSESSHDSTESTFVSSEYEITVDPLKQISVTDFYRNEKIQNLEKLPANDKYLEGNANDSTGNIPLSTDHLYDERFCDEIDIHEPQTSYGGNTGCSRSDNTVICSAESKEDCPDLSSQNISTFVCSSAIRDALANKLKGDRNNEKGRNRNICLKSDNRSNMLTEESFGGSVIESRKNCISSSNMCSARNCCGDDKVKDIAGDSFESCDFEFILNRPCKSYEKKVKKILRPVFSPRFQEFFGDTRNDIDCSTGLGETISVDTDETFGKLEFSHNFEINSDSYDDNTNPGRLVEYCESNKQKKLFISTGTSSESLSLNTAKGNVSCEGHVPLMKRSIFDVTTGNEDDDEEYLHSKLIGSTNSALLDQDSSRSTNTKVIGSCDKNHVNASCKIKDALEGSGSSGKIRNLGCSLNSSGTEKIEANNCYSENPLSNMKATFLIDKSGRGKSSEVASNGYVYNLNSCATLKPTADEISDREVFAILKSVTNIRLLSPLKERSHDNYCMESKIVNDANLLLKPNPEPENKNLLENGKEKSNLSFKALSNVMNTIYIDKETDCSDLKYIETISFQKKSMEDKFSQTDTENVHVGQEVLRGTMKKKAKKISLQLSQKDFQRISQEICNGKVRKKCKILKSFMKLFTYHCFNVDILPILLNILNFRKSDYENKIKKIILRVLNTKKFNQSSKIKCKRKKISAWKIEDLESVSIFDENSAQSALKNDKEDFRYHSCMVNDIRDRITDYVGHIATDLEDEHKSFDCLAYDNRISFLPRKLRGNLMNDDICTSHISLKHLLSELIFRHSNGTHESYEKETLHLINSCCRSFCHNQLNALDFIPSRNELRGALTNVNEVFDLKTETSDMDKMHCLDFMTLENSDYEHCPKYETSSCIPKIPNRENQLQVVDNVYNIYFNLKCDVNSICQPEREKKCTDSSRNVFSIVQPAIETLTDTKTNINISGSCKSLGEKYEILFGENETPNAEDLVKEDEKNVLNFPISLVPPCDSYENRSVTNSEFDFRDRILGFSENTSIKADQNSCKSKMNVDSISSCYQFSGSDNPSREVGSLGIGLRPWKVQNVVNDTSTGREIDGIIPDAPTTKKRRISHKSKPKNKSSESSSELLKHKTEAVNAKVEFGESILDSIMTAMTKQAEEFKTMSTTISKPINAQDFCPKFNNGDSNDTLRLRDMKNPLLALDADNCQSATNMQTDTNEKKVEQIRSVDCLKKQHDPTGIKLRKLVEKEISKFVRVEMNTVNEAQENMKNCIAVLGRSDEDTIANVIVAEILANVDEKLQEFERPAPPLTQTQHRIMSVLSVLSESGKKFEKIIYKILKNIRSKFFPENFFWPDDSLEMATRFYAALCKKVNDFKGIWKFCFKALSDMRQRWSIPIFVVLQVWPDILHNADNVKDNLPVNAFVNLILQEPKLEQIRRKQQVEKLLALKHLLINFYNFEVIYTMEVFTQRIYDSFFDGIPGAVEALVLIAKCRDWIWTVKNIIPKFSQTLMAWMNGNVSNEMGMKTLDIILQIITVIPENSCLKASPIMDLISNLVDLLNFQHLNRLLEEKVIKIMCRVSQKCNVNTVFPYLEKLISNEALYRNILQSITLYTMPEQHVHTRCSRESRKKKDTEKKLKINKILKKNKTKNRKKSTYRKRRQNKNVEGRCSLK